MEAATAAMATADGNETTSLPSPDPSTTPTTVTAEPAAHTAVVFQLLSSDEDDDDDDDDDDAGTTLGSPVPAAQTLTAASPLSQEENSGWMQRRPIVSRPKRIETLFAAVETSLPVADAQGEHDAESDARPVELMLSPASQLHVLSQISEMAESRAARERQAKGCSTPPRQQPPHAWAPIAQHAHRQTQLFQPPQPKNAKRKPSAATSDAASKKLRRGNTALRPGLIADMATWETLDEPILEGDDVNDDAWSMEELSDSDF